MDKKKEEKTTISISKEAKELLDSIGKKGMTYDAILLEILIDASKCVGKKD